MNKQYYIFMCVCAYALARGRVHALVCMRACSLVYLTCNAYAPYCDVINGAIFGGEKLVNNKMCVLLSNSRYNICLERSHSKMNLARYCHKRENVFT